jgi:DNA-directed RNA polymerase specialized sigma subunit
MYKPKGSGVSFQHPLGSDPRFPRNGLTPERLLELTKKLRLGIETASDRQEIAESFIHLALAIAGRYATPTRRKLDDFVSCALFGIVNALNKAKEKLQDDNLKAWIIGNIHGFCKRFRTMDHIHRVPQTTNSNRKRQGKEIIPFKATVLFSELEYDKSSETSESGIDNKKIFFDIADKHDEIAESDVRELLYRVCDDEVDRQIIDLRIEGYVDQEIADILQRSLIFVYRRRAIIQNRYERTVG